MLNGPDPHANTPRPEPENSNRANERGRLAMWSPVAEDLVMQAVVGKTRAFLDCAM